LKILTLTVLRLLVFALLASCGSTSFDTSSSISFEIQGVYKKPAVATGTASPKWIEVTVEKVELLNGETATELDLLEAKTFNVIARPQIFYLQDIEPLIGNSYTGVRVTFNETARISGKYYTRPMTFSSPIQTADLAFTIAESQSVVAEFLLYWQHIVVVDEEALDEIFLEPDFVNTLTAD
jgi:hypothetical protein